jgi:hypothetical protein
VGEKQASDIEHPGEPETFVRVATPYAARIEYTIESYTLPSADSTCTSVSLSAHFGATLLDQWGSL